MEKKKKKLTFVSYVNGTRFLNVIDDWWDSDECLRHFNTKEENLKRDKGIHMVDVAQLEEH
jgi:hypothetical protein